MGSHQFLPGNLGREGKRGYFQYRIVKPFIGDVPSGTTLMVKPNFHWEWTIRFGHLSIYARSGLKVRLGFEVGLLTRFQTLGLLHSSLIPAFY